MKFVKYIILGIVSLVSHLYLGVTAVIIVGCLTGGIVGLLYPQLKRPVLTVLGIELGVGIIFGLCFWSSNTSISRIENIFNIGNGFLPAAAIIVNAITILLVTTVFFQLSSFFSSVARNNTK